MVKYTRVSLDLSERREIERLLKLGAPHSHISRMLSRSKNCINFEIRRNGGSLEYNAEVAHMRSKDRAKNRTEKLKKGYKIEDHPTHRLKVRMDALEMQVDLLMNLVRDLKNEKNK